VHNPTAQYNVPEIGKTIADKAHRDGVAQRFADAAVHKTSAVDLSRIPADDALRQDLERALLKTARHHDLPTRSLLQTVPGLGKILRRGLLYAMLPIERFPPVQDFASSCRLVTCRQASGGKRLGTSGNTIGNAHLQWAFSEAATLFVRNNPQAQKLLARLQKKHDQGQALSILAQTRGRAVSCLLPPQGAFHRDRFLQTSGSRAAEPGASLDTKGMSRHQARSMCPLDGVFERLRRA
jgi:transposase